MAGNRRTRPPYERYGVPRDRVEADYRAFYEQGGAPNGIREGEEFQRVLANFGFDLEPRSGWNRLAYEIRLIELGMAGLWPEEKGHAQLARECRKLSGTIDKSAKSIAKLSHRQAVSVASMFARSSIVEHISDFFDTARRLDAVAEYLEASKQPTKWASSRRREARLVLACKLAPIFETEFGKLAKPRGGSEAFPNIRDEAAWTQFYQGVAKLVLGEAETPDRQDILWEAAKPSEIPNAVE